MTNEQRKLGPVSDGDVFDILADGPLNGVTRTQKFVADSTAFSAKNVDPQKYLVLRPKGDERNIVYALGKAGNIYDEIERYGYAGAVFIVCGQGETHLDLKAIPNGGHGPVFRFVRDNGPGR